MAIDMKKLLCSGSASTKEEIYISTQPTANFTLSRCGRAVELAI